MAARVTFSADRITVTLSGWDRLANLRRGLDIALSAVSTVCVEDRSSLERLIDHRVIGFGTHIGEKRPNRRRVGTMLGRSVRGKQFWVVPAGDASSPLLVVELATGDFSRLVAEVEDPYEAERTLRQALEQR